MNKIIDLPSRNELLKKSKSLAMLDAIICQDWGNRYFSHNSKWNSEQEMGSMRDGEGDDYFILFYEDNVAIKGCCLGDEFPRSPELIKNIHQQLPVNLSDFLHEPAFSIEEASFVFWFDGGLKKWNKVEVENIASSAIDGSEYLLGWLVNGADYYQQWAEKYYEANLNTSSIKSIFNHDPLSMDLIMALNADADLKLLDLDVVEIGYPAK